MKLWQKGESIDKLFERFTIGNDPILDLELAYYDVLGSQAHVRMLGKIGLLTDGEVKEIHEALDEIAEQIKEGRFTIEDGIEDCHSQIEMILTEKLGDTGKKVHAGRSRNDQVLTALKLYTRDQLTQIAREIDKLFSLLLKKSDDFRDTLMPGYTHMQVAMPSSFGLWFGAYAESLIDDLILLKAAYEVTNKNPLGSAAGYGASFPLDRDFTTSEMGFSGANVNVVYAQMTRGKMEKTVAYAISSVASTLARYSMDICLYNGQDFGFFDLDKRYTTGSSIMPHKHNPDGFELVRGKCNQLIGLPNELSLITANLPSGYHRDLQVLKDHYIPAIGSILDCLKIVTLMTENLNINKDIIHSQKYDLLFTVEEVNRLVQEGLPFRDAYRKVAEIIQAGDYIPNREVRHTHLGSVGNLGNERIRGDFDKVYSFFK